MVNREQWLAERRTGIGSSDAAAVCGLSPWSNPLGVYLDKTGQLPDWEGNAATAWGTRLEPIIADAYQAETGVTLKPAPLRRHGVYPWMIANVDRVARDRIVEIKTANFFARDEWGEPGSDEIPEHYLVQVQHQLAVCPEFEWADVAVLIGGQDFRVYCVQRNAAVIDRLTDIEAEFWGRVQNRTPPEPDWSHPRTAELIDHLYGLNEIESAILDDEAQQLVDEYVRLGDESSAATAKRAEVKARLIYLMGGAGTGCLPDGRAVCRKTIERKAYEVKATSYIEFRIKQPKKSKEKKA